MDENKKKRLEAAGFRVGSVAEFLNLTPEEQVKLAAQEVVQHNQINAPVSAEPPADAERPPDRFFAALCAMGGAAGAADEFARCDSRIGLAVGKAARPVGAPFAAAVDRRYVFHAPRQHAGRRHHQRAARLRVRLACDPRLTFPVSDVYKAERMPETEDRYRVCTTFMGLHGTDSPLPSYYLEQVAYEHAQGIGVRPAFFDFIGLLTSPLRP